MAPSEHHIVTLKLAPNYLNNLDFSGTRILTTKRPKKRTPPKRKVPDTESNGVSQSPSKLQRSSTPADLSSNTVHTDPILGNLPRSLKAAPAPNTAGLVIDKIPCRRWERKPLMIRTFTGFECKFVGWCSEYTDAERKARETACIDEAPVVKADPVTSASISPSTSIDYPVKQLDVKHEIKSKKITLKLGKPPPPKEESDTNESSEDDDDDEEDDEEEDEEEEIAPPGTVLSDAESEGYANNSEFPSSDPSEPY